MAVSPKASGHRENATLAVFERDLLGEHHVSNRRLAYRPETQPKPWAASYVDLADVRHDAGMAGSNDRICET
jgi:hypothetical protein